MGVKYYSKKKTLDIFRNVKAHKVITITSNVYIDRAT
jgi:hypothetical protein